MEKRKSDRVQFFQLNTGEDIQPVWVFRHSNPEAILGVLLDIGAHGAQVLTDRSQDLAGGDYRLIVHCGNAQGEDDLVVNAVCRWSRHDGTLYIRNGLIFDEETSLDEIMALHNRATSWLRCEVLPRTGTVKPVR